MRLAACLVALNVMAPAAAVAQPPQAASPTEIRDERPLLWNGLRAGMSPREVYDTLRTQRIRARLARDPANGREFVETPGETRWAGRPYLIAMGFVENRLFYVEINSHRMLAGRIPFERSHFSEVARLLTGQYGQPVEISPAPSVTNVQPLGTNMTARGRFERGGVRADLTGNNLYASLMPDVSESVTVRFWRVVDAERLAASQQPPKPAE
jgi:hypothetical protein